MGGAAGGARACRQNVPVHRQHSTASLASDGSACTLNSPAALAMTKLPTTATASTWTADLDSSTRPARKHWRGDRVSRAALARTPSSGGTS